MKINHTYTTLAVILIIGIIIRGVILFHISREGTLYPTLDEMNYRELAENVLDYNQYATWSEGFFSHSTRAPIFPIMIGSSYILSGNRGMSAVKYLNIISDIFTIYLLFLLGSRLFNTKTGLISASLYAVFGHALYYMQISNPHTFATMLLMLVCLALLYLKKHYRLMLPLFSILYALLIHTRPVFLVALPFLIPAIYLQLSAKTDKKEKRHWLLNSWKQKLLKTLLPIAIIAILCLPWGIRNYKLHHTIVPVCTVAGWHIASNINFDLKLSIKYLMDNFFAPEHQHYTEGDFFDLSKRIFYKSIIEHPFKIPAFGLARLIYLWTPPARPFYRFLLPKAYIFPINISDSIKLPFPDFEGFLYLLCFATFAAVCVIRKKTWPALLYILYRGRSLLIIVLGYSLVHIIGIPLISYRFLIEPLLLIFGTALLVKYFEIFRAVKKCEIRNEPNTQSSANLHSTGNSGARRDIITLITFTTILLLLTLLPLLYRGTPKTIEYKKQNTNKITYTQLRNLQWQNLGNIPPDTKITLQGIVKYLHKGFKYPKEDYYAEKNAKFAAGRLYVRFGEKSNPLGIGDVRLNFPGSKIPKNGEAVTVTGTASTGLFKEIIIDVDTFEKLPQK